MRWIYLVLALCCTLVCPVRAEPLSVLILSGQNNHDWQETTPLLRKALEPGGRFSVEILEQPESMTNESVAHFDVILSNWNALVDDGVKEWPEAARDALINFVRGGKGFVSVHAGSSSFYDWDAYQELAITSLDHSLTEHRPRHTFRVTPTAGPHAITKGVEPFDTFDELQHRAPLQPGAQVLATAFSPKDEGGTGRDEPVLMTREFGKGRSVNFLLGHGVRGMSHPSFGIILVRCVEWAATGDVAEAAVPMTTKNIHDAAAQGLLEEVKAHMAAGTLVDDLSTKDTTALYSAISRGNLDVARFLIEQSANLNSANQQGWTSLHYATLRGNAEAVQLLLDNGAEVDAATATGWTPLHFAGERGKTEIATALIAKGASLAAKEKEGWTPLHHAAVKNKIDTAELLLHKGADVNAVSNGGGTPLHEASVGSSPEMITLLLAGGAEINARTKTGKTALGYALEFEQEAITKILLEQGAKE